MVLTHRWIYLGHLGMYLGVASKMVLAMGTVEITLMPPLYDRSKALENPMAYMEGGSFVKFEYFDGASEKLKALTYIQQFGIAYGKKNSLKSQQLVRP